MTLFGTVIGLVAIALGAKSARVSIEGLLLTDAIVVYGTPCKGLLRALVPWLQAEGLTLGQIVIVTGDTLQGRQWLLAHELGHVRQMLLLGPLMAVAYPAASLIAWLRGKQYYTDNWFEIDARAFERFAKRVMTRSPF
jgi:hypothetical protein